MANKANSQSSGDDSKNQHSKENKFKQQKLPAFQPILTSRNMMPVFFVIGVVFVTLGIVMHVTFSKLSEFDHDYTHCKDSFNGNRTCAEFLMDAKNLGKTCFCNLDLKLEKFNRDVFVYYGLSNFYQNHRRYVRSRDDDQLNGKDLDPDQLVADCDPYRTDQDGEGYAPCGAIANSIFNDTFSIEYRAAGKKEEVGLIATGIAWDTDTDYKFNNPKSWSGFTKPRDWNVSVWDLDPSDPSNNGYENEDLIVWMRTAALPKFRKLYRRVDHRGETFSEGLPAGTYRLRIAYNFPVTGFGGTKTFILANVSWLGSKNLYIGVAYILIGGLAILQGVIFLVIEFVLGHKSSTTAVIAKSKSDLALDEHPLTKKKDEVPVA